MCVCPDNNLWDHLWPISLACRFTLKLVMWRLSRSKWRFLKENRKESISGFFGASVTRFLHCITLEGPANCAGCHRIAFTPPSRESIHAKCGGVYIYDSEYWGGNRNQVNVEFFLEKVNWIEKKKTIVTSLLATVWVMVIIQRSLLQNGIIWYECSGFNSKKRRSENQLRHRWRKADLNWKLIGNSSQKFGSKMLQT